MEKVVTNHVVIKVIVVVLALVAVNLSYAKPFSSPFFFSAPVVSAAEDDAETCYRTGRSMSDPLADEFKSNLPEIEKWATRQCKAVEYLAKSRQMDRAHFGVAASRQMGDIYYQVINRYYEYIYALPKNGRGNKRLLAVYQKMVEIGNNVLSYYNDMSDDAHYAWDKKVYEQDGVELNSYVLGDIHTKVTATKKYIRWAEKRIKDINGKDLDNDL